MPCHLRIDSAIGGLGLVLAAWLATPASAQEQSVKPGINAAFESPDVDDYVDRFEQEGRDAFRHRREILEACRLQPGMSVADVGAGTGLFTRLFAEAVGPRGRVFAVDISDEFIAHIDESAKKQGLTNIIGVVCDPDNAKLPDDSVDLVYICDTYHHFEYPHKTMRSIWRALKPGGRLVLIDFHRIPGTSTQWTLNHVRAGQEVFSREIAEAGFRQIDERKDMLDESYFVVFEKASQ